MIAACSRPATANVPLVPPPPPSWWRWSLVALGAVALVLLIMQVFSGTPGTNVQPGTPVAAPQEPAPQP